MPKKLINSELYKQSPIRGKIILRCCNDPIIYEVSILRAICVHVALV
jgi:hypothetical protein